MTPSPIMITSIRWLLLWIDLIQGLPRRRHDKRPPEGIPAVKILDFSRKDGSKPHKGSRGAAWERNKNPIGVSANYLP